MVQRKNDLNTNLPSDATDVGADALSRSAPVSDLRIEYLSPDRLRALPNNARAHSKKQLKQIARSIERFGFLNPVLISDDCEIVAGHGRFEAAKMLGLTRIPTLRLSNLSAAERRAYAIADNRLAELSRWNRSLLATDLQRLLDLQFDDVELTGFSLDDVNLMLDDESERTMEQPVANDEGTVRRHGPVVSRAGDVWLLGRHRLHCAEAARDCDVIIRRWQQFTGKRARLDGSALSFAEVAARRHAEQTASMAARQGTK